jgi:hypothetical protein
MQRRLYVPIVLIALLGGLFFGAVKQAYGFQAWIQSVSGDCSTVQINSSLIWDTDDGGGYDYFRIEIYNEDDGSLITGFDERLTRKQSPWFWRTHAIDTVGATNYRIEMWDIGATGKKYLLVDRVLYSCSTDTLVRPDNKLQFSPEEPLSGGCRSWVDVYSTNVAPEDGIITVTYTFTSWYDTPHYFWTVFPIEEGERLVEQDELAMPCGVYARIYYQPDSTKQIYYLPAQYWPQGAYGTASELGQRAPRYYTVFPTTQRPQPEETTEEATEETPVETQEESTGGTSTES